MSRAGRDPQEPHDRDDAERRLTALLELLGDEPCRVLELGCGEGRVLAPLVEAGHDVTGLDRDETALARARARLAGAASLVRADFRRSWPLGDTRFDAVCCLGNTFMLLADVGEAVDLLRQAADRLAPGGMIVLDDVAADLWPELIEGRWTSGASDDGAMQLVWARDDAVFAIREGADVDLERWEPRAGETLHRLWTRGAMTLAARLAGLSDPAPVAGADLIVLRRLAMTRPVENAGSE